MADKKSRFLEQFCRGNLGPVLRDPTVDPDFETVANQQLAACHDFQSPSIEVVNISSNKFKLLIALKVRPQFS